jgi:hypothetical protein
MERQGNAVDQGLMRGVNWAPDSFDESGDSSASEVSFVPDSVAGDTEVPDSQGWDSDEWDAADGLLCLASTDVSKEIHDKEIDAATSLLLPVFLPRIYHYYSQGF